MNRFKHFQQRLPVLAFVLVALWVFCSQPLMAANRDEGILLVAFGTSVPEAKTAFDNINAIYEKKFPDTPVVWAFTSQIIRKKLASQGIHTNSIAEGLAALARDGVKTVRVQSLHVMAGEEFAELARALLLEVKKYPGRFSAVYLGRPLLESREDARETAAALLAAVPREKGEALVLMGHGQEHGRADLVFEGVRGMFHEADPTIFVATVEGARDFDDLVRDLKAAGVKKIVLQPLMVVAGDHARNDLAGEDDDSWASRLRALGFETRANLEGLGNIPGVVAVFGRHTEQTSDDLTKEPKKP